MAVVVARGLLVEELDVLCLFVLIDREVEVRSGLHL
jgi:hypothetical protein